MSTYYIILVKIGIFHHKSNILAWAKCIFSVNRLPFSLNGSCMTHYEENNILNHILKTNPVLFDVNNVAITMLREIEAGKTYYIDLFDEGGNAVSR